MTASGSNGKKEAGCHPKMNGVVDVGDMLFNNPEKMQRRNWILTVGDVMGIFTAVLIATSAVTAAVSTAAATAIT